MASQAVPASQKASVQPNSPTRMPLDHGTTSSGTTGSVDTEIVTPAPSTSGSSVSAENVATDHAPAVSTVDRLVKLVAVGLKEASADSPSFRASMNFADIAVTSSVQMLQQMIGFLRRYSDLQADIQDMQEDFNSLFPQLSTEDVSNEIINKDVVGPCINSTITGTNQAFKAASSLFYCDTSVIQRIQAMLDTDIPPVLELRTHFLAAQEKHDALLAKYMSLPKANDAAKTREDALQLFEIRKQHVHLALKLWTTLKDVDNKISSVIVDVCTSLWPSAPGIEPLARGAGMGAMFDTIKSLQYCFSLQSSSYKLLLEDLNKAMVSSEKGVIKLLTPSQNLQDYMPSGLSSSNIYDESDQMEKHGWVYMKSNSFSGSSGAPMWIRRWLFLKNDVFGFLSISPNGCYVEESDRIGILLANVRYYPEEDRKFCFEIKTLLTSIVLQVETLEDLRSWMTVFRNVKMHAMEFDTGYASARYTPLIDQFRLTPVCAKDLELVSASDTLDKSWQLINSKLSHARASLSINPPLPTQMSSLSVLAHIYMSSYSIPTATTANFWGFVNWGLYYVVDNVSKARLLQSTKELPAKPVTVVRYPSNYPYELRLSDAELRAIFEAGVTAEELLLVKFKGSWSPNSSQELYCTVYVTDRAFYMYTSNCGLVSVSPLLLSEFLFFDTAVKDNYDELKAHLVSGFSMKMKVFVHSAGVIKDQINMVLRNSRSDNPKPISVLLDALLKTKNNPEEHCTTVSHKVDSRALATLHEKPDTPDDFDASAGTGAGADDSTVTFLWKHNYSIPAKALFHILLGDESSLMESMVPLVSNVSQDASLGRTVWRCDAHETLSRIIWTTQGSRMAALQRVEKMVNNNYYRFTNTSQTMKLMSLKRQLQMKFVIYSLDSKSCSLVIFYSSNDNNEYLSWLFRGLIQQVLMYRVEELDSKINQAIKLISRERRKVASAIKLFGVITKYDSNEESPEEAQFSDNTKRVTLHMLFVCYWERVNFETIKLFQKTVKQLFYLLVAGLDAVCNNATLLSFLLISVLLNVYLLGHSSYSYWQQRSLQRYADMVSKQPAVMERAISLAELDSIMSPQTRLISYNSNASRCFKQFAKVASLPPQNVESIDEKWGSEIAENLIGLRMKRGELLSRMNVVNNLEENYIYREWQSWVLKEFQTCEEVRKEMTEKYDAQIQDYCESVRREMEFLNQGLI